MQHVLGTASTGESSAFQVAAAPNVQATYVQQIQATQHPSAMSTQARLDQAFQAGQVSATQAGFRPQGSVNQSPLTRDLSVEPPPGILAADVVNPFAVMGTNVNFGGNDRLGGQGGGIAFS